MKSNPKLSSGKANREIKVKCYFCNKPIHESQFGGVFKPKDKPELFCNNLPCLIVFSDWDKKNRKLVSSVEEKVRNSVVKHIKNSGEVYEEIKAMGSVEEAKECMHCGCTCKPQGRKCEIPLCKCPIHCEEVKECHCLEALKGGKHHEHCVPPVNLVSNKENYQNVLKPTKVVATEANLVSNWESEFDKEFLNENGVYHFGQGTAIKAFIRGVLQDQEKRIIDRVEGMIRKRKPTHGACCTCQDCGFYNDIDCECERNATISEVVDLLRKENKE